jgi:WD40 repeat protein
MHRITGKVAPITRFLRWAAFIAGAVPLAVASGAVCGLANAGLFEECIRINGDRVEPTIAFTPPKVVDLQEAKAIQVNNIAFSPDGTHLAATSIGGFLNVWAFDSKKLEFSLVGDKEAITCFAYSPDGRQLASGGLHNTVKLWSAYDGKLECKNDGHSDVVSCVAYDPKGEYLASAGHDRTVRIIGTRTCAVALVIRPNIKNTISSVAFSRDGKEIVCAHNDNEVILFNVATGIEVQKWRATRPLPRVADTADGRHIAWLCDGNIMLLEPMKNIGIAYWPNHPISAALMPNGDCLGYALSREGDSSTPSEIVLVRIADGRPRLRIFERMPVTGMCFSPNNKMIACVDEKGTVHIWAIPRLPE